MSYLFNNSNSLTFKPDQEKEIIEDEIDLEVVLVHEDREEKDPEIDPEKEVQEENDLVLEIEQREIERDLDPLKARKDPVLDPPREPQKMIKRKTLVDRIKRKCEINIEIFPDINVLIY